MAKLFSPITIGPHTYANRIAIAPMAQYSADDGSMTDWHLIHLGALATSGAGLVMIEATSVEPMGRCSLGDPGLYNNENEAALCRVIEAMRRYTPVKVGIQLSHGGRKGSTALHWLGGQPLSTADGGWENLAPSALPFGTWPTPKAADAEDLERLVPAFADSARRAARAGVDLIELHAAHGYLLHQFLSPISNERTDAFGGSLENRMRLPLRVFEAVRDAAPGVTLGVRLTASDWIDGGITPDEAVAFAQKLEAAGCHYVDVTSGGIDPRQKIAVGPGYQVSFAHTVKQKTNLVVRAVGLIVAPEQAEEIVASGKADLVAIARAALANPRWPWEAAHVLGAPIEIPPQYQRASSSAWPGWTILAPKEAAE
ncbi:NADH:flavin oxidoreductase/NADH oxidase [Microvirga brassicacearum]|uniref:NADH:flavin oxidoreductase/NADH oxidase n=1 Tax=Microvirga brassicacearum TaxID=2580413 RepID=A0A5N3P6G8_9HYPH|nr:NADH:flavin oxidoreductase/NADH oxidase [Microvirga brassicacearum]KAB0265337.1 NADH:flavin oxidoreductase/NADH oxidase [Microvirga brassicacearum]